MAAVIADIYEIEKKIGAGGGGVVYLGRHKRLDKQIVLKADRRRLSVGTEKLRREVDLLKGLSHTYIPQVYDFVQENGVVYTVMDYVEGISLDKVLARKQKIPQKMIVRWACQLLEALSYLHKQKPHGVLHGDIKPANIMLRSSGDICLIDFNIALALGEDGAVRVGYSRGYASPEHYGSGSDSFDPLAEGQTDTESGGREDRTQPDTENGGDDNDTDRTQAEEGSSGAKPAGGSSVRSGRSTGSGSGQLLLDARSDIYSLGATLYHLLSGKKPAEKAVQVVPLHGCCSPQIADIITKSMNPDPDSRYQTAGEMLDAFLQLRTKDSRVRKNKRRLIVSAAASVAVFLIGGICTFVGMKQRENYQSALKLASYSQTALADGNPAQAVEQAMRSLHTGDGIFRVPATAQSQKALADALGVYDLTDGFKPDGRIDLPSAPFSLEVSPGGTRYAAVYAYEAAVYAIDGRKPDAVFPLQESALSDCLFVDEDTVIYAGKRGVEAYDLAGGRTMWTGDVATCLTLSGDGRIVAAVDREADHAVLYDVTDGTKIAECSFAGRSLLQTSNDKYVDRADYIFALDETGKWLAASFSDGGLSVFDTKDPENELILYDASDYEVFSGGFSGELFAYAAQGAGEHFFGVLDLNEQSLIGTMESRNEMLVQTNADGFFLSDGNLLARFDADTLEESEMAYTEGNTIQAYDTGDKYSMVVTDDGMVLFYDSGAQVISSIAYEQNSDFIRMADGYALTANRTEPFVRILRLDGHKDACLFSYDVKDVHSEARVSADGQAAMLFDYEGFRIYDHEGSLLAQGELPDAEQVYDQQFRRDGVSSYLEVFWYDGTVRRYGMDGKVLGEDKKEAPSQDLEEEFETDRYRIVSKLHEPPKVYDKKSGKLVAELEKDDGLAYVTQLDGYIMTEYVSTDMERYGILLDEDLQQLAYLPGLCDVYDNTVVFDYHNGELRSGSIYSLDELEALGNKYRQAVAR